MKRQLLAICAAGALVAGLVMAFPAGATVRHTSTLLPASKTHQLIGDQHWCNTDGYWCTEPFQNWNEFPWYAAASKKVEIYPYIGHDEPSVGFYSNTPGAGYDNSYLVRLPKEPPTLPNSEGSGGTFNFQLHPAFWLGLALCDDQSAPNPDGLNQDGHATVPCTADSDTNIYSSTDPNDPHYMGMQPGGAYMEMQWYPPGWTALPAGVSCDATKWCSAMTIDELSSNSNSGAANNTDCLNRAGIEPQLFAYLTHDGVSTSPANALNPNRYNLDRTKVFFQNPGDLLRVHLVDTTDGFQVVVDDLTTKTSGSMTASTANGFGQIAYDPNATTCSVVNQPFHPEFATSGPTTRLMWTAHTYNVAYSDEIGHFGYCGNVTVHGLCSKPLGADTKNGDPPTKDNPTGDDWACLGSGGSTLAKVSGCLGTNSDFDGASYQFTWPGSQPNRTVNKLMTPEPIVFSSPTIGTGGADFDTAEFEADLSRIEDPGSVSDSVRVPCQRHIANPADPHPGKGCVKPPPGSTFYPFFSTTTLNNECVWQEGGSHMPMGSDYGGVSQFGPLEDVSYPTVPFGTVTQRYNDFQQILPSNPCPLNS
jgi:hypothetical protein